MLASPQNPLIALEIHDVSFWEPRRVLPILPVMEKWGYNALVLHQNDLLDACTQLGLTANYGVSDLRLKKVRSNVAWLNRLVDLLAAFDAKLFLEIKEPSFHDYAQEMFPALFAPDGTANLGSAGWAAFCRRKVDDLLARAPGIGGLVVNLSSPESRVSMPDLAATAERPLNLPDWFDSMITAFREPLAAQGKALWVRDFSYTADVQSDVLAAINRCEGKVGASVKATAHDYFPEFPDNPGAGAVTAPLILEFDASGEHMGWGVIPNCRVEELRRRMSFFRDVGASGFLMRTSWEAISGMNALDNLSAVNVFALPVLMHEDCDAIAIVLEWLKDQFSFEGPAAKEAAELLLESWHIPAAAYWDGKVFPRHSCLPSSWQEGWLSMETSGMGRRDRALGIVPDDPRLSDAARVKLFKEKEAATRKASTLSSRAEALKNDLPPDLVALFAAFRWLPLFARQFELAIKATFLAARNRPEDRPELSDLIAQLDQLAACAEDQLSKTRDIPHHATVLFAPDQIRRFTASLQQDG